MIMGNIINFSDKKSGNEFLDHRIKKNLAKKRAIFVLSKKKGSYGAISRKMTGLRSRGIKELEFAGNEPTKDKYFFSYLAAAQRAGFEAVTVFTDGAMFSDGNFLKIFFGYDFKKRRIIVRLPADKIRSNVANTLRGFRGDNSVLGQIILDKKNAQHVAGIIEKAKNAGIKNFIISPFFPFFDSGAFGLCHIISKEEVGRVVSRIAKIKGASFHLNFVPACIVEPEYWPMLKFSRGLKNILLVFPSGKVSTLEKEIEKFTKRKNECKNCDIFAVCEGAPLSVDINDEQEQDPKVWLSADLHIGSGSNRKQKMIIKDAQNFEWSQGFFVGDFVEGDNGEAAFKKFKKLTAKLNRVKNIHYIIGNHEFCYKNGRPHLEYYKKYVDKRPAVGFGVGNIRFIFLHHTVAAKNNIDHSQTITKTILKKLEAEIKKNSQKITVVLSHQPPSKIKIASSEGNLLEHLAGRFAPDIWCFGHSDIKIKNTGKFVRTSFIYCGGSSRTGKSKVLVFDDRDSVVSVLTRNHFLGSFESAAKKLTIKKKQIKS
jgi:hypothetical protein